MDAEINRFLATVKDRSRIRFPARGCYKQDHKIQIADRQNLEIDGNGSTFTSSSTKLTSKGEIDGNWVILRGNNITLANMTSNGAFTAYGGRTRSLAAISQDPNYTEASMNYGLYGVDTVHLTDIVGTHPWGDGVTTGPSNYVDGQPAVFTKNVFIERVHIDTTARMCVAPTSGTNIWIRDSTCKNDWYGGIDAEADNTSQPLQGLHILNNTFEGFNNLGIFVPVAGTPEFPTKDIEIRENRFLSPTDQKCAAIIQVGGYPNANPNTFANVVAENNTMTHYGPGIVFDHVRGGLIRDNTLTQLVVPGTTPQDYCGVGTVPVVVTNSADLRVLNNGPDVIQARERPSVPAAGG